ncbi:hypothetical protein H1057_20225 [Clostridium sporogenes]|uniref:hypothetical protein n=1 Tax=Clostridium sporogenes TaxID=1509 RepID=UPI0015EFC5BB|nr:hypothetical protein [Clostridium sporogenes]MBA4510318.1 hypothetical protein [Clostridium sporogenes]
MSCKCASYNGEGRYNCSISGDGCIYLIPNSKRCAEEYGEGPDAPQDKCEDCKDFYYNEENKRCCKREGHLTYIEGQGIVKSPLIEDVVVCCGGFKGRENI